MSLTLLKCIPQEASRTTDGSELLRGDHPRDSGERTMRWLARWCWRRLRRMLMGDPTVRRRVALARLYLRGEGIEIGALHNPLPLPRRAKARYVDRLSVADLRRQYPDLRDKPLVKVDI